MRLLVVTQTLDKNDSNLGFFHSWVLGLAKKFETVKVIALNVGAHDLPGNVTVHTLGKELGMERIPRMLRYVALLVRFRREYTHVFAHMNPEYVIGGGLIWRMLGKKIGFWYVHGAVTARLRIAELFAHKIFTASRESCRLKSGKVSVVGHGIDTDAFSPGNTPHPPTVITTGRFSPSKRLELIIDAMKDAIAGVPDSRGRIVGDAGTPGDVPYASQIKKLAASAGIEVARPVVHADVPSVLHLADVFLNASTTSSIDKAVLEAMACGVIPVTSNSAFANMLTPWKLYVDATRTAFAARIIELLRSPDERKSLAAKVREEVVRNHSLTRLIEVLAETYRSL